MGPMAPSARTRAGGTGPADVPAAHAWRSPPGERWALGAIVMVALLVRVLYARRVGQDPLSGDALEFHLVGNLLADGRGWIDPFLAQRGVARPTADKPPLYELTLAGLSLLGLRSPGEHHASGVITGVLLVPVVAALAREAGGRRATVLLAAGACAVYPPLVMADGSLRSESLFALLVACAVLCALRLRRSASVGWAVATGAAVALAALTRGEALLLLALLPLAVGRRGRPVHLAAGVAVAALVLAPWLIRCWTAFDQPVVISTNAGGLLAGANCPDAYPGGRFPGAWSFACLGPATSPNEARASDALRARGVRYAGHHARQLPEVLAIRVGRTLELYHPREQASQTGFFEGRDPQVAEAAVPAFWLVALLAGVAVALRALRAADLRLLLAPAGVVLVVTLGAYGWPRLRAGAEPELLVLAAFGAVALLDRVRRTRPERPDASLASTAG